MAMKGLYPRGLATLAVLLLLASCSTVNGLTGPTPPEPLEYSMRPAPMDAGGFARHLCTAQGIAKVVASIQTGINASVYEGCVLFSTQQRFPIRDVSQPLYDRYGQVFFIASNTDGLFTIVYPGINTNLNSTGRGIQAPAPTLEGKQNIGEQNANRGTIGELAQVRTNREPVRISYRQSTS